MDAGQPVVVFGDSLAVGVSQAIPGSVNLGVVGWGLYSRGLPPRLDALHDASRDGGLVLLSVGTNDTPGDDYTDRLRVLRSAVSMDARVVWLLPPPACGRHLAAERIVPLIQAVARENGDDVLDASTCERRLRAADGVHFTADGYRRIGEEAVR